MTTTTQYLERAREAGSVVNRTFDLLVDLIRDMLGAGISDYDAPEHRAARDTFARACVAAGRTANNARTIYARAWDALIAQGAPLTPRPARGRGGRPRVQRAAAADASSPADGSADASVTAQTDVEALVRTRLAALLAEHGLTQRALADLATTLAALNDAVRGKQGPLASLPRATAKQLRNVVLDAVHVAASIGRGVESLVAATAAVSQ